MLLDRIDELERELARAQERITTTPPPPRNLPLDADPDPEPDAALLSLQDTQPIGLRDRLRLATGRRHDH
jgi:hypothetical protein